MSKQIKIDTVESFVSWFRETIDQFEVEHFAVCAVDRDHHLLDYLVTARGGSKSVVVDPRKIFRFGVCVDGAAALLVAHNHPGGKWEPSSHDMNLAFELSLVGRHLRLPIASHIIITPEGYKEYAQRFNR